MPQQSITCFVCFLPTQGVGCQILYIYYIILDLVHQKCALYYVLYFMLKYGVFVVEGWGATRFDWYVH